MGETDMVTMSNVSPTRMIHMNGRVGPQPTAPSSFNSTLSGKSIAGNNIVERLSNGTPP